MSEQDEQPEMDEVSETQPEDSEVQVEKVGCGPAIVAGTLLMGIVFFLFCGVTTWVLFQKRTEFASRTIQGFIPMVEQSLLDPDDKEGVIDELESLVKEMRDPEYEPALAGAIMERLVRLPIPHWGELDAVESYVQREFGEDESAAALKEISRVRHSVEIGKATVFDLIDVLEPVSTPDDSTPLGRRLQQPLEAASVREVIQRAKLLAERDRIPDQVFEKSSMTEILGREIQKAKTEGGF